ncbi:uncharacterized protein HMPREF1541_08360 [Cyphellophora europaea CBS 101466]|uniref:Uncharacterized protein n=1 Tax=Cyphellophora europaea (strain CBS 101466) TaxID=1220924 RepID=W2RNU1_CYPE1|nr:uncharacterized protein HMPREF1541_08360 [Cyphellophora europaea CBS 101466]ETN37369.1 hypothetical protein HMPREF1541_08360 [Cyphellophora europaea CBS 101466]
MAYPPMPNEQQRRHSSAQYLPVATRYDDEDPYSEGESSYHPHAVRPIRHSTFPPSSYYNSSQQKQVQPYRSPYVHPALPPQSPTLGSAVAKQPQQQFSPPPGDYEPPRYTYQPPTADPPRPSHPVRAETWGHGGALRSGSVKRESGRKGSSVPPSSRSVQDEGHEKPKKTKWQKAKQIYNSKPANNTAELALVGLLAVAKAL